MQQIRNEIEQSDKNLIPSIPEKHWQLSEIAKTSKVDMVSSQGQLLVCIHSPLKSLLGSQRRPVAIFQNRPGGLRKVFVVPLRVSL